jgi:hypothetical protein
MEHGEQPEGLPLTSGRPETQPARKETQCAANASAGGTELLQNHYPDERKRSQRARNAQAKKGKMS